MCDNIMLESRKLKLAIRGLIISTPFIGIKYGVTLAKWSFYATTNPAIGVLALMVSVVICITAAVGIGHIIKYVIDNLPTLWRWTFTN